MIPRYTIGCWILLFFPPGYYHVLAKVEVVRVAQGLDATLRCPSKTSFKPTWEWNVNLGRNIQTLVLESTAYLLVEKFQETNVGLYYCVNETDQKSVVKLEIQKGVNYSTPVFRRPKTGPLQLFCEALSGAKLEGFWRREQTASEGDSCKRRGTDLALIENRSEVKNWKDNKFELRISPLLWEDHGHYRCVLCKDRGIYGTCNYEIITVDVYQEPAELMEGENGSVVCNVSHAKEGTRLLWIEVESQQKVASADGFGIEFALSVRNVTLKRSAWVCAVFYKDRLRALLPLNLTIKRQGISQFYLSLVCLAGLVLCLATVLIIYIKMRHRRHQGPEQRQNDDTVNYASVHFKKNKGAEGTPNEDAVNYAALHFKKRKETEQKQNHLTETDDCRAALCATEALPTEEDSVIYSGLALTTRT